MAALISSKVWFLFIALTVMVVVASPSRDLLESVDCLLSRADKGWAVKRAWPSKKVWCSGLGLCLEISLVFDFGQGLRCALSIRHCRCHWIMAAWFVFLHFFLVPFCWYAVSERQMLLFFFLLLLPRLYLWIIFSFYYSPMSMLFQNFLKHEGKSHPCHPWQY